MVDFEKEIARYGSSLSPREKEKAREVFNELLARGRSFEWLYYAVLRLNGRSILECPKLMFYKPFQDEVERMIDEAREEEQKKQARNAAICARIEEQIKQMESRKVIIVRQSPPAKKQTKIDLAAIAETEDDDDGAMPQNERTCLFEKTDSKNNLLRRVRGL